MLESVDSTIAGLRSVVGAQNDSELASKLGIDKSTVSGWRARGRVPTRFVKLLATEPIPSVEVWPELHDRGTAVALARYVIMRNEVAMSGNVDMALPAFLHVQPFWIVMHRAVHDLRAKMDTLHVDLQTAAALLLQEDLRSPRDTAARVARMLAEDLADSPHLQDWK